MAYATFLTHVQTDAEGRARLGFARRLAERFGAALLGVGAQMVPPLAAGASTAFVQADWYAAVSASVEEDLKAAESAFWAAVTDLPKGGLWAHGMDFPGRAVANASRGADLIIASPSTRGHHDAYRDAPASELLISSGRPILIVPTALSDLKAERVVLAWKDSREARRALSDSLPIMQAAKSVTVVEVCREADKTDATARTKDVAHALGRHGVTASSVVSVGHGDDALQLISETRALNADLIIAGGYGHSRLGEWVFGGVTDTLLWQNDLCVLLSH